MAWKKAKANRNTKQRQLDSPRLWRIAWRRKKNLNLNAYAKRMWSGFLEVGIEVIQELLDTGGANGKEEGRR